MKTIAFCRTLFAASVFAAAAAPAQSGGDRALALDDLGRGTAAFRAGDIVAATRHWSEAIRLCRRTADPDLDAQALASHGEACRVAGYYRDARDDLRATLATAKQSGDETLVAAASGALGNLAFMPRRTAVAEPLLERSRDLARRLRDWPALAASENDLGNLDASIIAPGTAVIYPISLPNRLEMLVSFGREEP
jgi:tetratricopeptide (TPR) repeat protein